MLLFSLSLIGAASAVRDFPPLGSSVGNLGEGWGPEETTQHSGYVDVNQADGNDGHIFFWLFESRTNPADDPLVLWLTGGPGCSSEIAIFFEQGPYRFMNGSSLDVTTNPYAWNSVANVLFVDQPVGTGFSYADANDAYCSDEKCVGEDMWEFLTAFMEKFPKYASQDFYVTGESYAGHYVPAISYQIYQKNKQAKNKINMKGFAIGNGLVNPSIQYYDYPRFSFDNGLIKQSDLNQLQPTAAKCVKDINNGAMFTTIVCNGMLSSIRATAGNFNVYDVRKPCVGQLCYDFSKATKLMAEESVTSSLGVSPKANWQDCNMQVHQRFSNDWWSNLEQNIPEMLDDAGYHVLIYSGKEDWICNWYGGRDWVGNMTWSGHDAYNSKDYSDWMVDETKLKGGEFKSAGNLTFLAVDLAGHMVPMDVPQNARSMLQSFISGKPFMSENSETRTY